MVSQQTPFIETPALQLLLQLMVTMKITRDLIYPMIPFIKILPTLPAQTVSH
jgi:hypothetical protein